MAKMDISRRALLMGAAAAVVVPVAPAYGEWPAEPFTVTYNIKKALTYNDRYAIKGKLGPGRCHSYPPAADFVYMDGNNQLVHVDFKLAEERVLAHG